MVKYFSINAEGCSIRCKLYTSGPAGVRSVILFGHGFGGHKDNKAAERFAGRVLEKNKGVALVCFDWPCHGDDVRKTLRLEDCGTYLRLVLAHIEDRFGAPDVFAYAVSFGAYLFLKYISENGNPFSRIALRCPAVKMYDVLVSSVMTEDAWERLRKGKPALVGFDRKVEIDRAFLDSLEQADVSQRDFLPYADDLMILQGTKDEIVPFSTVKAFAEENVIEFVPVEGGDHRFLDPAKMDFANAQILSFFGMK